MYQHGNDVEKDKKKEVYHLEQAAIVGDPGARYALGCHEGGMGNNKRAVKHFTIAANLGHDESLANLKKGFNAEYSVRKTLLLLFVHTKQL